MKTTYFWLVAACCGAVAMGCSGGDDAEGGPSGAAGAGGVLADAPYDSPPKEASTSDVQQDHKTDASSSAGIGSKCSSDADCGSSDLTCLLPNGTDLAGGGPAHGYCSKKCDDLLNGDVVDDPCAPLGGVCHDFGTYTTPNGWCLQTCTFGGGGTTFSAKKCRARHDVGCTQLSEGEACLPICGKDADCPTGFVCDPRTTVCVDAANAHGGDPLGAACTPGANQSCAGQCFQFTKEDAAANDVGRICSQLCVSGTTDTCNFDGGAGLDAGSGSVGFCLFGTSGVSTGDRGVCGQLCDVDSDCLDQVDNVECAQDTVTSLGHGYCHILPGKQSDAGASDAQSDGSLDDGPSDAASGDAQGDDAASGDAQGDDAASGDAQGDDAASGDAESDASSSDAQADSADDDGAADASDDVVVDALDDVDLDVIVPTEAATD